MRLGSLFTGYGGLEMAVGPHFDAETVWCSDIDPGACKIIAHRFPDVPNLGDITRVDWTQVEPVDVLTGGFPCQDLSHAGKRLGLKPGTRSGLWTHMAYAISQLRPRYVVAENVRGLLSARADSDLEPCPWCVGGAADGEPDLRALGAVLGDLAGLGYDARWVGLRAADVGAPHGRFRIFILATDSEHDGRNGPEISGCTSTGEASGWLLRPQGSPAADADRGGLAGRRGLRDLGEAPADGAGQGLQRQRDRDAAHDRGAAPADAESECGPRIAGIPHSRGPLVGAVAELERSAGMAWGDYEPAIHRWESILGRPAPAPTEPGPKNGQRLSPRFVEFMMGLPEGWVTDVPGLSRNAQLKALGNGVVPQQAAAAQRILTAMEAAA